MVSDGGSGTKDVYLTFLDSQAKALTGDCRGTYGLQAACPSKPALKVALSTPWFPKRVNWQNRCLRALR